MPQRLQTGLLILIGVVLLLLVSYNYATDISFRLSAYYNEGPILNQAMRLTHGENIYDSDLSKPPYLTNNYGPLYYLLQWPFLIFSGPSLLYGKLISLISSLGCALFAGLIAQHLTGNRHTQVITSLLVLASPLAGSGMPLYHVDVLAQCLSLAGIYFGITAQHTRTNLLAASLFVAVVYTKLTYGFAGPASVFLYRLMLHDYRRAMQLAIASLCITLLCFGLAEYLTHGGFAFHMLQANLLHYSLPQAFSNLQVAYIQSGIATLAIPLLWVDKKIPSTNRKFCSLYFICSCIVGMTSGRVGANYGYFSEFQIALAILMGVVIPAYSGRQWILAGQIALYGYFLFSTPYARYIHKHGADITRLMDTIRAEQGIILADDFIGLLALTGKPLYIDSCGMTQLQHAGLWQQEKFLGELRAGAFPMILMGDYGLRSQRWTPEMLEAIQTHYHMAERTPIIEIWRPN